MKPDDLSEIRARLWQSAEMSHVRTQLIFWAAGYSLCLLLCGVGDNRKGELPMAKFERTFFNQDFDTLVARVERIVKDGSVSATLEDKADYDLGNARCAVRVFERYAYSGGNRVSMNVTIFQSGDVTELCAITSGGSQALLFKVNTIGETLFLDTLREGLKD